MRITGELKCTSMPPPPIFRSWSMEQNLESWRSYHATCWALGSSHCRSLRSTLIGFIKNAEGPWAPNLEALSVQHRANWFLSPLLAVNDNETIIEKDKLWLAAQKLKTIWRSAEEKTNEVRNPVITHCNKRKEYGILWHDAWRSEEWSQRCPLLGNGSEKRSHGTEYASNNIGTVENNVFYSVRAKWL
jgi:hypothetical protein